jgi:hypothetical protein
MAVITSLLLASTLTRQHEVGLYNLNRTVDVPATGIANGDNVQLLTIGQGARLVGAHVKTSATLGAGATLQLQRNRGGVRTNISAATAAGAAGYANGNAIGPVDLQRGDIIEALVGGAGITSAATVEVDLQLQH